jgi:hypothetical protein
MPTLLSRIEREYILNTLEETLPSFSVLSGSHLSIIPGGSYACHSGRLNFPLPITAGDTDNRPSTVRFFFFHKQRGMFFDINPDLIGGSIVSFDVPGEIFLDNGNDGQAVTSILEITVGDRRYTASLSGEFPLDSIMVNPCLIQAKKNALEKIMRKAGIHDTASLVAYRLFEYLDSLSRHKKVEAPHESIVIFADHQYVVASLYVLRDTLHAIEKVRDMNFSLDIGKRKIIADATLSGLIPVSENQAVVCLDISSAKEEDKRFLYERLYRQKYH